MANIVPTSTVLLVSANNQIRLLIRQERNLADKDQLRPPQFSQAPLLCVSDLAALKHYIKHFHDLDTVMLDAALLEADTLKQVEQDIAYALLFKQQKAKLVLLCTGPKDLHRLGPAAGCQFRLLNLYKQTPSIMTTNMRL